MIPVQSEFDLNSSHTSSCCSVDSVCCWFISLWRPKNTSLCETATTWRRFGSSKSVIHHRFTLQKVVWQPNVEKSDRPADRKSATDEQSGWETDSQAYHRKAGRQEVWGGRLQREQTAGMLNYHTSVHGMSTPLTTALPCAQSSQTAASAVYPRGSVWYIWFHCSLNQLHSWWK